MTEHDQYRVSEEFIDEDEGDSSWITTFADICLLLLVFFILLFSMSSVSKGKFQNTIMSVSRALGNENIGFKGMRVGSPDQGALLDQAAQRNRMLEAQKEVFSDFQMYFSQKGSEGIIGANLDAGKISLRIPGNVLFASGEVELTEEGRNVLQDLEDFFIRHSDQQINIQGYTDDVPPASGSRFKDNWEISSLRAINVLRFFLERGLEPERLTATGFADMRPLVPNNTEENRARNRRVEIVLEKMIGGE
ncbi:MAG: flagellar motor protein MotB [Desulfonatronovibrionaceae bacterium]